jgi:hypothetical protein
MSRSQALETKNNSTQAHKPQEPMCPPEAHGTLRRQMGQVPPKGLRHHCGPNDLEPPGIGIEAGDLSRAGNVLIHETLNLWPLRKDEATLSSGDLLAHPL